MENLAYQRHLSDPTVRAALDVEVRRLRHEAIDQYIVTPIKAAFAHAWRPLRSKRKPVAIMSPEMDIEAKITRGQTRCFQDVKGFEIRVGWGCLWITQQDDTTDYVLIPGETFRVTRDGATLVHAVRSSYVHVAYSPEAPSKHISIADAVRALGMAGGGLVLGWLRGVRGRVAQSSRTSPQLGEPA